MRITVPGRSRSGRTSSSGHSRGCGQGLQHGKVREAPPEPQPSGNSANASRMAREASLRVGLGMPRQVDDRFEGASRTEAVGWHRGPARRRGARVRQGARARYQGPHRSRAGSAEGIRVLGRLRPAAARSWSRLHGAERYAGRSRHGACHGREGRGRPVWRRRSSWLHRDQGDQPSTGRAPGPPPPTGGRTTSAVGWPRPSCAVISRSRSGMPSRRRGGCLRAGRYD